MPWEVEALDPVELQRLVLAAVAPYVDSAVLGARVAEETRQRARLRVVLRMRRRLAGEGPDADADT
ncbi:hypothetical protein ACIBUR_29660 [Streptomyces anulatus]